MNWINRLWAWLRRRRTLIEPPPKSFDDRWHRVPFEKPPPPLRQQPVLLADGMKYHRVHICAEIADEEETIAANLAAITLRELNAASSGYCAPAPAEIASGGGGDFGGGGASGDWDAPPDEAPAVSEPPPPAEPSPAASPSPDSD
jgi:hypothetical protein